MMKTNVDLHTSDAPPRGPNVAAEAEHRLAELAQQWDGQVRRELSGLAELLWSDEYLLGVIPIHHYRVRYQAGPRVHVWWVEHDLPPGEHQRCAAYRVLLSLDADGNPTLTVQSGAAMYAVSPLTLTALTEAVANAGGDDPLIVPPAAVDGRPTAV